MLKVKLYRQKATKGDGFHILLEASEIRLDFHPERIRAVALSGVPNVGLGEFADNFEEALGF